MLPPYLYLHQCGEVLLAASPSRLDFFHIDDGSQLTSWNTSALLKEDSIGNFNPAGGNIKGENSMIRDMLQLTLYKTLSHELKEGNGPALMTLQIQYLMKSQSIILNNITQILTNKKRQPSLL
jgi:hypothetical protein